MPCRSKKLANLSFNISRSAIQLCILSIYLIKQPGTEFGASNVCKMSERVDPQCWDRFKNAIRGLYIANGHKLEGPDGVITKMEERHGFKATKAQYEKKFKEWRFKKNHTKEDWRIVGHKVEQRKRAAKESNVYLDQELMPQKKLRKEISRQGYMSCTERTNKAHVMSPETPPGFDIRTPTARPVFRLVFEDLPILQFQEVVHPLADAVKSSDSGLSALMPLFGAQFIQGNPSKASLSMIESLIPKEAFNQEPCATEIALGEVEKLGVLQFLSLAAFLITNNFPGETSDEELYKWFAQRGTTVLKTMTSMEGKTVEALREKLFRIAVEAEDVPTVKLLIKAGVDPNGHICRHSRIPDNMNPFQFACIRGNTELVHVLVDAGSVIDQPGNGWKSSGLVLAIIGENLRGTDFWGTRFEWNLGDHPDTQETAALFLILIRSLIDAGAAINPKVDESSLGGLNGKKGDISTFDLELPFVITESHSPLTVASKYRNRELVDIFLQKGADVNFRTKEGTSALQECLYSTEERRASDCYDCGSDDCGVIITPKPLSKRKRLFPGAESLPRVIGVAQSLLAAGNDVHGEVYWHARSHDRHGHTGFCTTTFELSVLTESAVLVKMMLRAGGNRTARYSLDYAINIGDFELVALLLDNGAPLSPYAVQLAMRREHEKIVGALLKARPHITIQRMVLAEAIVLGNNAIINQVFECGITKGRKLLEEHHGLESALQFGPIDTLRLIIDKSSMCDVSISPYLGGAVLRAVDCGNDQMLDTLLSAGADVNAVSDSGQTALVTAIRKRNRNAALGLIDANSITCTETTLNRNDKKSTSSGVHQLHHHKVHGDALIMAIQWGDDSVVEKLLNAGASVDALGTDAYDRGKYGCTCITPLTAAIMKKNLPLVDKLISMGAAVNNPFDSAPTSRTPLTAAIMEQNLPLVNKLISMGAAVNNPSDSASSSMTPLATAVREGHIDLVGHLIRSGANPYDSLALEEATADFGLLQVLLTALDSCDMTYESKDVGYEALKRAMERQDQITVVSLLDALLKYNKRTDRVLPGALLLGALDYDTAANYPIVRMVLDRGADPNAVFEFGEGTEEDTKYFRYLRTALCVAIDDSPGKVRVLLTAGADAGKNLTSGVYDSPVQFAVSMKNLDTVRILLENGSNANTVALPQSNERSHSDKPPRDNGTPLQIAVSNRDTAIIKLLLEYKANANAIHGNMPHTSLQMASRDGGKEIVELLLEHGADVNAPPAKEFGATALQFAAIKGLLGIAYLLLQYGADVNAPAAEVGGRTALEGAAEHGRIDMVQLLLNSRANIFEDGQEQYENAVRIASENGHHVLRGLLESYHG
ncbi:ankyrin repeat-containing domain protein [Hyaloscypha finlandica]|nr:ankyrin repeat-containing domain protein [Hyaloscypha finlandica]